MFYWPEEPFQVGQSNESRNIVPNSANDKFSLRTPVWRRIFQCANKVGGVTFGNLRNLSIVSYPRSLTDCVHGSKRTV